MAYCSLVRLDPHVGCISKTRQMFSALFTKSLLCVERLLLSLACYLYSTSVLVHLLLEKD